MVAINHTEDRDLSLAEKYEVASSVATLVDLWFIDEVCTRSLDVADYHSNNLLPAPAAVGDWLMTVLVKAGAASQRLHRIATEYGDLFERRLETIAERQNKLAPEDLERVQTVVRAKGGGAAWAMEQTGGLIRALTDEMKNVADRNDRISHQKAVNSDLGADTLCFLGGAAFVGALGATLFAGPLPA